MIVDEVMGLGNVMSPVMSGQWFISMSFIIFVAHL